MDVPDDEPWKPPVTPVSADLAADRLAESDEPPKRSGGTWRDVRAGFRISSSLMGPILGAIALLAATPIAVGLGAGRGFGVHPALLTAGGLYLVFTIGSMILGAAIGLVLGRIPPRPGVPMAADRPIRLRFWSKREAARPARGRRWPWILAGLAVLVLEAAFGVGVYLGRLVDRRLDAAIAAANLDDPNWRLDDLMAHREPVPDQENSAIVVAEVVMILPENWPLPPGYPASDPPLATNREIQDAYDRAVETPENLRLDDATADALRHELDEYVEAVRLARTVVDRARGRHELEITPSPLDIPLTETQEARTAARLLAADAALLAQQGDLDAALDSCRATIGVGRSIGDEPFLVSQLVRISISTLGLKSARRVLGQGEPSDAALARLQALVIDEMNAPLLLQGMRGERATTIELIQRIGSGELPISALSGGGNRSSDESTREAVSPWGQLAFDYQRAVALEWMNQAVTIARRPLAEQPPGWNAWDQEFQRVRRSRLSAYTTTLPLLLAPALMPTYTAQMRYRAELGTMALLLAAERYRRRTGDWPTSADAMPAELLMMAPPLDLYSGRPFLFNRQEGRLIVHSVGPNLKDEHGRYEPKRWNSGELDDVGATAWDVALRRQTSP